MIEPEPGDPTPTSGSPTDVAPVGRTTPKPPHEQTAEEEMAGADWDGIAAAPEFRELLASKARFIIPTTIFFLLYYFSMLVLVGFFPDTMKKEVGGGVNLAYLFALSQFFMAWIVAALYVVKAAGWDRTAANLLARFRRS